MITKKINDWCDKQFEEALSETNETKAMRKAAVSGAVRGIVDSTFVFYPIVLIGCAYWKNQALKK